MKTLLNVSGDEGAEEGEKHHLQQGEVSHLVLTDRFMHERAWEMVVVREQ